MLTVLFWNMGDAPAKATPAEAAARRSRLAELARALCDEHSVDMLVLAECPAGPPALVAALNAGLPFPKQQGFRPPDPNSQCEKVMVLPRFPAGWMKRRAEGPRHTVRHVRFPDGRPDILLVAAHLGSKLHKSDASQTPGLPVFAAELARVEHRVGHARTVLVGDLNMNQFQDGVVGAEGLNATMARHVAAKAAG